jgi:hypothetical protein
VTNFILCKQIDDISSQVINFVLITILIVICYIILAAHPRKNFWLRHCLEEKFSSFFIHYLLHILLSWHDSLTIFSLFPLESCYNFNKRFLIHCRYHLDLCKNVFGDGIFPVVDATNLYHGGTKIAGLVTNLCLNFYVTIFLISLILVIYVWIY